MEFQTGDFKVVRGSSLISKGIRLLCSVRYGIPYKQTHNHVESFFDCKTIISADAKGVVLKPFESYDGDGKEEYRVYRFKNFGEGWHQYFKNKAKEYVGKGYAYARYVLDTVRIVLFLTALFTLIFALIGAFMSSKFLLLLAGLSLIFICILTLIKPYLIKKDILTHDCVELQSLIYSTNELWVPLGNKSRNEFPDGMSHVLKNLELHGVVEIVCQTPGYNEKSEK